MSSIFKTLFDFATMKSVNLTLSSSINLDFDLSKFRSVVPVPTNISLAPSKLYNVSTLNISANVGKTSKKVVIFALPSIGKALEVDDIPVSAKFLKPEV